VTVKVGEQIVGKLDEGFLERLKRGDVFVLGGDAYEFLYARGMVASVRTSSGRPPTVPSWVSEMLPLSFDLSLDIQKFRYLMSEQFRYSRTRDQIMEFIHKYLYVDEYGANSIYEYFKEQAGYSEIPSERLLLIEHFKEDDRKHVLVHSLYGRRVNDVLSRAAAYAISRGQHKDVEIAISDNGFMLSYSGQVNVAKALKALSGQDLRGIMEQALDKTEILQRRFRHCAGRALMILRSYMGRQKTVGRQQVSSMLLINAVRRISEDFPVLKEARREVLEDLMDIEHAKQVLSWARDGKLEMREKFLDFPSPFSFNLVLQGYSDIFKVEDKSAFLKRMHQQVLDRIGGEKKEKAFSYSDLWEELQEEKRKQKIEHIEEMQTQLARVKFPRKAKEEISRLIEGAADVSQETIEEIKSRSEEIAAWPGELSRFVLQKGKELDEKTVMLKLLTQANYSAKLDNDVLFQLKRLLSGEREEFPRFFREWLDSFLGGTIGYAWDKKLIYFLRRAKDEMGD